MPTYEFINTDTGLTFEKLMPWADIELFLADNPMLRRNYAGELPSIGDSWKLGIKKPDAEFKSLLKEISKTTPGGGAMTSNSNFI